MSYIAADWWGRVFGLYDIVYILSDFLSVWTISSIWVHEQTIVLHSLFFSSMTACHRKICALSDYFEELSLYDRPRRYLSGPWTSSDEWSAWGVPRPKQYPPRYVRLITYVPIQHSSTGLILHITSKHDPTKLLKFAWLLPLVRFAKGEATAILWSL